MPGVENNKAETIGKLIAHLRNENGLSQHELAVELGYKTKATICAWETGRAPLKDDNIVKLARFFHVSADYLLGLNSDPRVPECRNCESKRLYVVVKNMIDSQR